MDPRQYQPIDSPDLEETDGRRSEENGSQSVGEGVDGSASVPSHSGLRRRRRGSKSTSGLLEKIGGSRHKKHRSSSSRRNRNIKQRAQAILIFSCFLLSVFGAAFAGFVYGQKAKPIKKDDDAVLEHRQVFPTPESEDLLNAAFKALQDGKFREAFLNFQKVEDLQPGLFGIDYLVAMSSMKEGELLLAEESARRAISKNEMAGQAQILLDLITLAKAKASSGAGEGPHFGNPADLAEKDMKSFAADNPADSAIYCLWGDLKRTQGAYQTASDLLHKGVVRSDPQASGLVLSTKEHLARLQASPSKQVPSLSELTSMNGEQAMGAALTALQHKQPADALHFLERARDVYPAPIFLFLLQDPAFDEFRNDPQLSLFFKK